MKKKIVLCLMVSLLLLVNAPAVMAPQLPKDVIIKVWTDKTFYKPGEEGKLFILIMNNYFEEGKFIDNITITYPWWPSYVEGKWVGNDTIIPSETERGLEYKDIYQVERSFKVPNDGRATSGFITIDVYFAGNYHLDRKTYLNVNTAPPSQTEGLDKITTLLAVQIVLTVISALILAAAIYISVRKLAKPSPMHRPPPPSPKETSE